MSLRRILRIAAATLCLVAGGAQAQQPYTLLNPPQPTEGGGKVEVIEFFSYACGHCYKLEPFLEGWVKKLPPDIVFKRIPGAGSESWTQLALMYFTFEAMGQLDRLHNKAFAAMHAEQQNLASPKVREQWLAKQGVDVAQYQSVEKSFSVQSKLARAKQQMAAYKVDGVPMVIVNGKWVTSTGHAGGPDKVVPVIEALVAMARKEMGGAEAPKPAAPAKK